VPGHEKSSRQGSTHSPRASGGSPSSRPTG
jgi:hypothetical protein